MKLFNVNDYPGDYAMLVDSREDAKELARVLDRQGRTWNSGASYMKFLPPDSTTCFFFNENTYAVSSEKYLRLHYPHFTFLRWSDFKDDAKPSIALNFDDMFKESTTHHLKLMGL